MNGGKVLWLVGLFVAVCAPLVSAQSGVRYSGNPPYAESDSATKVVIAGTYLSTAVDGGVVVDATQFVAQGFSLPVKAYAIFAELILDETEGEFFSVQFTNAIGPGTTEANVLASMEFQGGSSGSGIRFFLPLNFALVPGEYYLVLSATGSNVAAQPFFGGFGLPAYKPLPGTIGSPDASFYVAYDGGEDSSFPPASSWISQAPDSPIEFSVRGVTN